MIEIQDEMKLMQEKFEDMEVKSFAREVIEFIDECPSTYHVAKNCSEILEENGFERLIPQEKWNLKKGGKYYVKKSNSTVVAFTLGTDINLKKGFKIFGSHTDSPGFRIKPNPEMVTENILRLNTEVYGGPILSTWFDRPLSIAGRVVVKSNNIFLPKTIRVKIEEPLMVIPNLAIHQNREVNNGVKIDRQADTLPVLGLINDKLEKDDYLLKLIAEKMKLKKEDILDFFEIVNRKIEVGYTSCSSFEDIKNNSQVQEKVLQAIYDIKANVNSVLVLEKFLFSLILDENRLDFLGD